MANDIYTKIGAAIRSRRNEVGMTQALLASKAGLSRTSVTNIENGTQGVLVHQLVDMACALRLDPRELLAGCGCKQDVLELTEPSGIFAELLGKLDRPVQARRR